MFTVEWVQSALDRLADLWLRTDSAQRQAINAATNAIDRRLAADPLNEGEYRPGGARILHEAPLGVLYQVDAQRSAVTVLHVWRFRLRGQP